MTKFEERFGTEAACWAYLAQIRWPDGFKCPYRLVQQALQVDPVPGKKLKANDLSQESDDFNDLFFDHRQHIGPTGVK